MGCDDIILNIPAVPQHLGDQIIMVELGGNNRDGGQSVHDPNSTNW